MEYTDCTLVHRLLMGVSGGGIGRACMSYVCYCRLIKEKSVEVVRYMSIFHKSVSLVTVAEVFKKKPFSYGTDRAHYNPLQLSTNFLYSFTRNNSSTYTLNSFLFRLNPNTNTQHFPHSHNIHLNNRYPNNSALSYVIICKIVVLAAGSKGNDE